MGFCAFWCHGEISVKKYVTKNICSWTYPALVVNLRHSPSLQPPFPMGFVHVDPEITSVVILVLKGDLPPLFTSGRADCIQPTMYSFHRVGNKHQISFHVPRWYKGRSNSAEWVQLQSISWAFNIESWRVALGFCTLTECRMGCQRSHEYLDSHQILDISL